MLCSWWQARQLGSSASSACCHSRSRYNLFGYGRTESPSILAVGCSVSISCLRQHIIKRISTWLTKTYCLPKGLCPNNTVNWPTYHIVVFASICLSYLDEDTHHPMPAGMYVPRLKIPRQTPLSTVLDPLDSLLGSSFLVLSILSSYRWASVLQLSILRQLHEALWSFSFVRLATCNQSKGYFYDFQKCWTLTSFQVRRDYKKAPKRGYQSRALPCLSHHSAVIGRISCTVFSEVLAWLSHGWTFRLLVHRYLISMLWVWCHSRLQSQHWPTAQLELGVRSKLAIKRGQNIIWMASQLLQEFLVPLQPWEL